MFGIREWNHDNSIEFWKDKAHIDHFIFILPKKWDLMLRADRTTLYAFMDSMIQYNTIKENTAIPLFVFEYLRRRTFGTSRHLEG